MDMDMDGGSAMPSGPLTTAGVDFSNPDQAADFLADLLNDDQLKITDNAYARYFWYGIIVAIAAAGVIYWTKHLILRQRLRAAARNGRQPARPKSAPLKLLATLTAMGREATYLQWTPTMYRWLRVPPMGTLLMLFSYLGFVLALEFINNSVAGAQYWEARGVRAGWLAVAQLPLIILLVGKHNLVTFCTGVSVERLGVLHRWASRIMMLLAIFHFGFQSQAWRKYNVFHLEWTTDECVPTGLAAFSLLLWINISTLAPFRHWHYEFFVVQHILTWFGFVIAIAYHLPDTALQSRVYPYIPVGLYIIDRTVRICFLVFNNTKGGKATLTAMDGGVTKITIKNPVIKRWQPGQYMLLWIPKFGWLQTHPATIVSTPTSHDGALVFMLKGHRGFTGRVHKSASESAESLLDRSAQQAVSEKGARVMEYRALVNGPYGGWQADFAAFDSVLLLAGSTGCTFTLAQLQNIAERAQKPHAEGLRLPVRRVHFVWIVKQTSWAGWARKEIASAVKKLRDSGIEAEITIFVTCSGSFTDGSEEFKECGCKCDKSLGPCCCEQVQGESDGSGDDLSITPASSEQPATTEKVFAAATTSSALEIGRMPPTKLKILPCADFYSGRPAITEVISQLLDGAEGESGIACCGPVGLSALVRNTVVKLSDQRAIHKGSGAQGCYLHVESFS